MSMKIFQKSSKSETYISLSAVGDLNLGNIFSERIEEFKHKWLPPEIRSQLDSDIVFCNLEGTFSDTSSSSLGILVHANKRTIEALKYGNFNVCSLANNHMMDCGDEGLLQTIELLDQNNIKHTGAGMTLVEARKPAVLEVGDTAIAIHAYISPYHFLGKIVMATTNSPGLAPLDLEIVKKDIELAKRECDIAIVSIHWGIQNTYYVPPQLIKTAHQILNAGADIILGHHAHIVQGHEIHNSKIILYSLGNFLFPPPLHLSYESGDKGEFIYGDERRRTSTIFKCIFTNSGELVNYYLIPIVQEEGNNPVLTIPTEAYSNKVLRNIQKWSARYRQPYYPMGFYFNYGGKRLIDHTVYRLIRAKRRGFINTLRRVRFKHLWGFARELMAIKDD